MDKKYSRNWRYDFRWRNKKSSAHLATSGEKSTAVNSNTNSITNAPFSQQLENLPEELFSSKRFFLVGADKVPLVKGWSNPANQRLCTDIQGLVGFDTCGHDVGDDYLFIDFDHVLDDNGEFTNPLAEKWYNMIHSGFGFLTRCYCERSISGHGLHIFVKPTKGKFPAINGGDKGSIYFTNDKKNGAKIEIFYQSSGRYCLVTGKVFNCEPKATIPAGDEADDLFQTIIDALPKTGEHSEQGEQGNIRNEGNKLAEIKNILDLMPAEKLVRNDWATVGMILKYEGLSFEVFDSWSAKDKSVDSHGKARYDKKACKYQWDSFKIAGDLPSGGVTMGTLVYMGKKFGYEPPPRHTGEIVRTREKILDCPVDLILPDNIIFNEQGITLVVPPKRENGNPKYVTLSRSPVVVTKLLSGNTDGMTRYEIAIRNRGKWKKTEVDGQILLNPRKVYDLADRGVLITDSKLTQFFAELISLNDETIREITIYSKPGWHGDEFIYPNASEDADYQVARAGIEYSEMFSAMGEVKEWIEKFKESSVKHVNRVVLGASLAAPLLKVLGLPNFWLNINGRKNLAKTPILKFALSVYGNPQYLLRSFDSSPKNRVTMAVGLNDFPQGFDELETLGKKGEEELQKSIYDFVEGMDGQKNKRNGNVRVAEHFRGVRLSTGEQPLHKASYKGGAFKRAIDIHISKPLFEDAAARALHLFCARNYGHFGRRWIEYIKVNKEALVHDFGALCEEIFATFGNDLEPTHVTAICSCVLAYWHFRKCIGLEEVFDLYHAQSDGRIISRLLPTQDEISDVKRWLELLAGYVTSHPKHFWRKVVLPDGTIPTETFYAPILYGRIFDDNKVAINTTSFKEICAELSILSEKFINELYEGGYLVDATSKNKAKKIRMGNSTIRAYVFKEGLLWEYTQNSNVNSETEDIQA